tara:strand:+ start:145 stop:978 length:834 start_codon:yes stop_codon:yes gene_type:complete
MVNILESAEISSICDLACTYCPHPKMKRKKHFMELKTFIRSCELFNEVKENQLRLGLPTRDTLSLHQFGESLLHPRLELIFETARLFNIKLSLATNTKLLQTSKGLELMDLLAKYEVEVDVSEHLFKSPQAVIDYADVLRSKGINANHGTAVRMLESLESNTKQGFRHHEWLEGNLDIPKELAQRKCWYLKQQAVQIQADGRVVSCCADAEGDSNLGNIMDPDFSIHNVENVAWDGCKTCSLMTSYWLDEQEGKEVEVTNNEENTSNNTSSNTTNRS